MEKYVGRQNQQKKDGKINQKFNFSTMELHAKVGTFLLTMKKEERERELRTVKSPVLSG